MKNLFITLSLAVAATAAVGAGLKAVGKKAADAYGSGDTTWYVDGDFNGWDKAGEKYHLTYTKMSGNNWEFESDYIIHIGAGQKFKICYSWDGGAGYNEFAPNLQTNQSDFYINDCIIANNDINVKFYFQVYGESASWTGLYWTTYTDDQCAIYNWSVDFLKATNSPCSNPEANNLDALQGIWTAQSNAFTGIDDSAKSLFVSSSTLDKVADACLRYTHIVNRYAGLTDFVGGVRSSANPNMLSAININNNSALIIVVISALGLVSTGGFFFLRKKQENK